MPQQPPPPSNGAVLPKTATGRSAPPCIDPGLTRTEVRELATRSLIDAATATLRAAAVNETSRGDAAELVELLDLELSSARSALDTADTALAMVRAGPATPPPSTLMPPRKVRAEDAAAGSDRRR